MFSEASRSLSKAFRGLQKPPGSFSKPPEGLESGSGLPVKNNSFQPTEFVLIVWLVRLKSTPRVPQQQAKIALKPIKKIEEASGSLQKLLESFLKPPEAARKLLEVRSHFGSSHLGPSRRSLVTLLSFPRALLGTAGAFAWGAIALAVMGWSNASGLRGAGASPPLRSRRGLGRRRRSLRPPCPLCRSARSPSTYRA